MFTFLSSYMYPDIITKFTSSLELSYKPKIIIGLFGNSKQGIQIVSDSKIYELTYCKKMENGLLLMFENEIRFRIWYESSTIIIHVFSVDHNFDHQVVIPDDKIKTLRYYKFGNHNHYTKYYDIDLIFDFINKTFS